MSKKKKKAMKKAKTFCKRIEREKELRGAIAGITSRLNHSNLSAQEGKQYAKRLLKAYRRLKPLE
jgi:hypothetical protein